MEAKITPLYVSKKQKPTCPYCEAASLAPHTPFCSRRCAQLDLGKWLNEDYVIPSHVSDEDADLGELLTQTDKAPSLS